MGMFPHTDAEMATLVSRLLVVPRKLAFDGAGPPSPLSREHYIRIYALFSSTAPHVRGLQGEMQMGIVLWLRGRSV